MCWRFVFVPEVAGGTQGCVGCAACVGDHGGGPVLGHEGAFAGLSQEPGPRFAMLCLPGCPSEGGPDGP